MGKPSYPTTRREDVIELLHGITVHDPYRWLEQNTLGVLAWEAEQNALTDRVLSEWPDRERLREAIRKAILAGEGAPLEAPAFFGPFEFQVGRPHGKQQPVLFLREGVGPQRILADPNSMEEGSTLDWFHPSPQGDYVAYGISRHGDEQSVLHIVETRTGKLLPERIPHTSFARIAWLPDSSGFYYSGGKASDLEDSQKWLFFHKLGETVVRQADPMRFDNWYFAPQLSPNGRYLVAVVSEESPRAECFRDLISGGEWRPMFQGKSGDSYGTFHGDCYLALTTYQAPRGRIVSVPLATATDESTWAVVVPESDAVLRQFGLVGDQIVISELHNAYSRVRVVPSSGGPDRIVDLPGFGLVQGAVIPNAEPMSFRGRELYFMYCTFLEPPRLMTFNLDTGKVEPVGLAPSPHGRLEVRQVSYTSADGTAVSMFLVHRRDLDLGQPRPTLLHAYGGWNFVLAPMYLRGVLPFLQAGGVYAYANLRGGAEYGRDWWYAGRLLAKQNTFDDLYAAAEHLIASGITTRDLLAVIGASNGGLLTSVAVTQRPDLFRAVVTQVPITDMLRAFNDPYTAACLVEYGDPRDPELFKPLLAYSPVHNVKPGTRYPATFIQCGGSDIRCPPWNGRKLAALLQTATSGDAPILLRVQYGAGHGAGSSVDAIVERDTDAIGFVMQQSGMRLADS